MSCPLIILDRDGVINEDSPLHIRSVCEWVPIEGSLRAIARLKRAGWHVAVATNQSGIARGYFSNATLSAIHRQLAIALAHHGTALDHIAVCPHGPEDGCHCRKPAPGMLEALLQRFQAQPRNTLFVGDSVRDCEAAARAGIPFALVRTGKGEATLASGALGADTPVYADLATLVDTLLGHCAAQVGT